MANADRVFYYHTGDEKAVVGIAKVAAARPDDPSGRLAFVDISPVGPLGEPVTLASIKADAFFADFALVRMARLSVMPVTDAPWERIAKLGGAGAKAGGQF